MPIPADPNDAIRTLAEAVDAMSGRIAALTAYVAATSPILPDALVRATKGAAQKASPAPLAVNAATVPGLVAGQTIDQIRALAQALQSSGSGPQSGQAQP